MPLWPAILSDRLPVVGLVSHYLTNYLMGRRPLPQQSSCSLSSMPLTARNVWGISWDFSQLSPSEG